MERAQRINWSERASSAVMLPVTDLWPRSMALGRGRSWNDASAGMWWEPRDSISGGDGVVFRPFGSSTKCVRLVLVSEFSKFVRKLSAAGVSSKILLLNLTSQVVNLSNNIFLLSNPLPSPGLNANAKNSNLKTIFLRLESLEEFINYVYLSEC